MIGEFTMFTDYQMSSGMGIRYKRAAVIVPTPAPDDAPWEPLAERWRRLPQWLRVEHVDTARGRLVEHMRR